MVRTQLFLDNAMHARLRVLARKQGRTVSDLVREALERAYGGGSVEERLRTLKAIEGLWRDRKDIGSTYEYVRNLRRDTHRLRKQED
ncbi:MAG: ribbon-helix-helix protein, CopG family [Candidatus Eisenbacteria bacterium]|nr:ribbon-helix-helix protein, CopG family [Candidatus Eisenbacteria bacterium]